MSALLSVSLCLAVGCGSQIARDAREAASPLDAARLSVDAAVERGRARQSQVERVTTVARYNPAPCSCPDWEIRIASHWVRVEIVPPPAHDDSLPTDMQRWEVVLEVDDDSVVGETGWRYRLVQLEEASVVTAP